MFCTRSNFDWPCCCNALLMSLMSLYATALLCTLSCANIAWCVSALLVSFFVLKFVVWLPASCLSCRHVQTHLMLCCSFNCRLRITVFIETQYSRGHDNRSPRYDDFMSNPPTHMTSILLLTLLQYCVLLYT